MTPSRYFLLDNLKLLIIHQKQLTPCLRLTANLCEPATGHTHSFRWLIYFWERTCKWRRGGGTRGGGRGSEAGSVLLTTVSLMWGSDSQTRGSRGGMPAENTEGIVRSTIWAKSWRQQRDMSRKHISSRGNDVQKRMDSQVQCLRGPHSSGQYKHQHVFSCWVYVQEEKREWS